MRNPEEFTLILKNEKTGSYQKLGMIFTGFILVSFIIFLFFKETFLAGLTGLLVGTVYFVIKNLQRKKNPSVMLVDEKIFYLLAAVWLWLNILVAVLVLITAISFSIALQKFAYIFNPDGIKKDFFPRKSYQWEEMDSVILKGGILTINFKNDHLIQGPVEKPNGFTNEAFNDFAEKQVSRS